ncbi:MAG: hypothetical protein J7501_08630, partial [Bdellovibrio sp.]|nr:hypothetical protein [Bdellovibrio sp.]
DDLREAPALALIEKFLYYGARVQAADPIALEGAKKLLGFDNRVSLFDSFYDALKGADVLVIVTEWPEFKGADFNQVKSLLKRPVIFDGRNIFTPADMAKQGFDYISVGKESAFGHRAPAQVLATKTENSNWMN